MEPSEFVTWAASAAARRNPGYHLIPLELGGDPNDARNLWVEPGESPNPKDGIEHKLHQRVYAGTVSLAAAQQAIATDWTTALNAG